ncbi:MAG: hypothetical protein HY820_38970 [Acidobacteria bacterium]|nr:hypothetical protein [Acidobacteriota bacterium]
MTLDPEFPRRTLFAAALALLIVGSASAATITDGDFTACPASPPNALGTPCGASWTFTSFAGVVAHSGGVSSGNPGNSVRLEDNGSGLDGPTASQTVSGFVIGQQYQLSWDYRLRVNVGGSFANGPSFGIFPDSQTLANAIHLGGTLSTAYVSQSAIFTATNTTHTIIFAGGRPPQRRRNHRRFLQHRQCGSDRRPATSSSEKHFDWFRQALIEQESKEETMAKATWKCEPYAASFGNLTIYTSREGLMAGYRIRDGHTGEITGLKPMRNGQFVGSWNSHQNGKSGKVAIHFENGQIALGQWTNGKGTIGGKFSGRLVDGACPPTLNHVPAVASPPLDPGICSGIYEVFQNPGELCRAYGRAGRTAWTTVKLTGEAIQDIAETISPATLWASAGPVMKGFCDDVIQLVGSMVPPGYVITGQFMIDFLDYWALDWTLALAGGISIVRLSNKEVQPYVVISGAVGTGRNTSLGLSLAYCGATAADDQRGVQATQLTAGGGAGFVAMGTSTPNILGKGAGAAKAAWSGQPLDTAKKCAGGMFPDEMQNNSIQLNYNFVPSLGFSMTALLEKCWNIPLSVRPVPVSPYVWAGERLAAPLKDILGRCSSQFELCVGKVVSAAIDG